MGADTNIGLSFGKQCGFTPQGNDNLDLDKLKKKEEVSLFSVSDNSNAVNGAQNANSVWTQAAAVNW